MAHLKRTSLAVLALAGAASVLAAGPAASAEPAEVTLPSGAAVPVGDHLGASLSSTTAVFNTSAGKITCTAGSFVANMVNNPASGGTTEATETLTTLTFTGCTTTIVGVTGVSSVALNGTANVTLSDDGSSDSLVITNLDEKVKLTAIIGAPVCDYGTHGTVTSVTGALNTTTSGVSFAAAPVALISGSGVCPGSGTFTATFGPIIDQSQPAGNQALTIN
jgi:hypothetical protein